ncbi:DeoR/GlpR family DNA-binding transcription regulator [Chitinimonas sp.]|uniref:DeoR/GlpR family DNA-binding transcription regulator n=1 Tax=Chitinimonas sp. TaxID=1934313 RepID=UPI002F9474C6
MTTPSLLLTERQSLIQARLKADGRVLALDLARDLGVSEDTIRRDLRELAAQGLCRRVYGGALPLPPEPGALQQRQTEALDRKARLAQAVVTLCRPGQVWFIDAGSTNVAIAQALPEMPLTVVTNAPSVAAVLSGRQQLSLILIGGVVDPRVGACLGARALRDIEQLTPDLCVLGACGADAEAGLSATWFEEAEFKRSIANRSRQVLAAVTDEKLATAAPYAIMPAHELDYLVLEHSGDAAQAQAFIQLGVQVLHAQAV